MQRALGEAEGLYNAEDYAAAAEAAQAALGNPKLMACTAVIRGKALLAPVLFVAWAGYAKLGYNVVCGRASRRSHADRSCRRRRVRTSTLGRSH